MGAIPDEGVDWGRDWKRVRGRTPGRRAARLLRRREAADRLDRPRPARLGPRRFRVVRRYRAVQPDPDLGAAQATGSQSGVQVAASVSSPGPMKAIRRVVWNSDTRAGRLFDATVLTVIVAGLIVDATATLPSLDEAANQILALVSAAVTTLFVTEYVLRIARRGTSLEVRGELLRHRRSRRDPADSARP